MLTIEQAFQQGLVAQAEGKSQDAERIYRAILQSQPKHPDANHNLGVLAVLANKAEAAIPFFKTALQADPKKEQFWFSYIDALIKEQKFDEAKRAIEQIKNRGMAIEKLINFETQLSSIDDMRAPRKKKLTLTEKRKKLAEGKKKRKNKKQRGNTKNRAELETDAEANYNLGNTLFRLGKLDEAESSYRQAIALMPNYTQAYYNLSVTIQKLGRLEEAEASYKQVIELRPDYAEAHYNLGILLQELGRFEEAEVSYGQAITSKLDYAEAHCNLGIMLEELGRLDEAESSYRQAIKSNPKFAKVRNNFGIMLHNQGRMSEAEASYRQAIALKPGYFEAMLNLAISLESMNSLDALTVVLEGLRTIDADERGLIASVDLAICRFLEGDFAECEQFLLAASRIHDESSSKYLNAQVYQEYLQSILLWRKRNDSDIHKKDTDRMLYIVGDSHSLVSHHMRVKRLGEYYFGSTKLIKGCMQWNLGNLDKNQYKYNFENTLTALPNSSEVLLSVGEIDCRLDSGIIDHKNKFPEKDIKTIILSTVENYLTYVCNVNSLLNHEIFIQGVPCPNINTTKHTKGNVMQLIEVIDIFNSVLKMKSKQRGFGFLDVHSLTNRGDGFSNRLWHIDARHLTPAAIVRAWHEYIC